jgi:hypothetical protein
LRDVLNSAPGNEKRFRDGVVRLALVQPPPSISGDVTIIGVVDAAEGLFATV